MPPIPNTPTTTTPPTTLKPTTAAPPESILSPFQPRRGAPLLQPARRPLHGPAPERRPTRRWARPSVQILSSRERGCMVNRRPNTSTPLLPRLPALLMGRCTLTKVHLRRRIRWRSSGPPKRHSSPPLRHPVRPPPRTFLSAAHRPTVYPVPHRRPLPRRPTIARLALTRLPYLLPPLRLPSPSLPNTLPSV